MRWDVRAVGVLGSALLLLAVHTPALFAQATQAAVTPTVVEAAVEPPEDPPARVRQTIQVGAYVNQITTIDLKANQYIVDFWLWFRWRDSARNPIDTFELIGGRINSRTNLLRRRLPDGTEYAALRINATMNRQWDLTHYPFDDHELELAIEDAELEDAFVVFEADVANSGLDPELSVAGWGVVGSAQRVIQHTYHSNYGDTALAADAESRYSRFVFSIDLHRFGVARFFKVFFGLFVSSLVAWCSFFFRSKESGSRVSVSVGALFASAASSIAINSQLPDVNGITLADKIVFLCLSAIVSALLFTVMSIRLSTKISEETQVRIDRVLAVLYPSILIGTITWLVNS